MINNTHEYMDNEVAKTKLTNTLCIMIIINTCCCKAYMYTNSVYKIFSEEM